MITNVLRFTFKDGTTDDERAEVLALMRRTASVASVTFGSVGHDLGDPAEGFTHAYSASVQDLTALEHYMNDPVHIEGDWTILPRIARLSAVRFTDDPDPEIGPRIGALHAAKLARYPEWDRLLNAIPA
ncbi:Dabb family protein [Streptomyces avicenniae]|uniref:Dabb family protein n=1 Tax=Streptomyces avicenniae TaxID=500153 RepID=UPI00069B8F95|nr:Dabb family protein [Streptomyces avicenniae]